MAKVKKTKKPKTAVVPMTFNGDAVTPIGVDASWTGLAVTALEGKRRSPSSMLPTGDGKFTHGQVGWNVRMSEVLSTKPEDYPCQAARMESLGCRFMDSVTVARALYIGGEPAIRRPQPCLVAIEGYAMGSKTRPQMAGELGGHLRLLLWQAGIPYIIVPPTTLKKYVLGSGNAAKELMLKEVFKRWGYDTDSNDRADAYGLARVAAEFAAGGWTKKFEKLAQGFEVVGVRA
jgi:Holliday junction resolvasome RuvABC endonuclease subunit